LIRPNSQQRVALNVKSKGRGRQHAGTFPSDVPVEAHASAIRDYKALSTSTADEVSSTRPYYRSRQTSPPVSSSTSRAKQKSKKASSVTSSRAPLLDDARTEHTLLAARRIGMQRAGILSGILVHQEQGESNFEAKNAHLPAILTERTSLGGRATTTSFVYVNTPGTVQADAWEPHDMKSARRRDSPSPHGSPVSYGPRPGSMRTVSPQQYLQSRQSLKTPSGLDSLVSAARSMLDTKRENWPRESDCDHSPKPKRRKLSTVGDGPRPREGLTRVKSALDVLADHAAGLSSKGMGTSVHVTTSNGKEKHIDVDGVDANPNTNTNPNGQMHPASSAANALTTGDDKRADSAETGIRVGDQTPQSELLTERFPTTAFGKSSDFRPVSALENGTSRTSTFLCNGDGMSKRTQDGEPASGQHAGTGLTSRGFGLTKVVDGEMLPLKSGLEQSLVSDFPAVLPSNNSVSAMTRSPIPLTPPSPVLLPFPLASRATPMLLSPNDSTQGPEHNEDDDWLPPHPELISLHDFDIDSAPGSDCIGHDSARKKTRISSTRTRREGDPLTRVGASPPTQAAHAHNSVS
jgi:hypothetical protein